PGVGSRALYSSPRRLADAAPRPHFRPAGDRPELLLHGAVPRAHPVRARTAAAGGGVPDLGRHPPAQGAGRVRADHAPVPAADPVRRFLAVLPRPALRDARPRDPVGRALPAPGALPALPTALPGARQLDRLRLPLPADAAHPGLLRGWHDGHALPAPAP